MDELQQQGYAEGGKIKEDINSILSKPISDIDKSAAINAYVQRNALSRNQLAEATGYTPDVVNAYLGDYSYSLQPAFGILEGVGKITPYKTSETPYYIYDNKTQTGAYADAQAFNRNMLRFAGAPSVVVPGSRAYIGQPDKPREDYPNYGDYGLGSLQLEDPFRTFGNRRLTEEETDELERGPPLSAEEKKEDTKQYMQQIEDFQQAGLYPLFGETYQQRLASLSNILSDPRAEEVVDAYLRQAREYNQNIRDSGVNRTFLSDSQMRDFVDSLERLRRPGVRDEYNVEGPTPYDYTGYAEGGVARYFAGGTDGMADQIPAQIENQRPAALSDGEFVIPADVVSHLGNGNSTAGARRLYEMMDRIREARTGTTKQSRQIDANDFTLG
jgi:hypothetical protein